MIPTQEEVEAIKAEMLRLANYDKKGLSAKIQNRFRREIDACRIWLSFYDTADRELNYRIEQDLRLLTVKNFIGI